MRADRDVMISTALALFLYDQPAAWPCDAFAASASKAQQHAIDCLQITAFLLCSSLESWHEESYTPLKGSAKSPLPAYLCRGIAACMNVTAWRQ